MVEFDLLSSSGGAYQDFRYDLFTDLFGTNFRPYVDEDGHPRIGPAIDLRAFMSAAATAILGGSLTTPILNQLQAVAEMPYTSGQSDLLQSRLDQVLDAFRSRSTPLPQVFQFSSTSQAMDALNSAMALIESEIGSWRGTGAPLSEERTVVASLAHEGYDISRILDDLTIGENRSEAWFAIRYQDRSSEEPTAQQAVRRYYQSSVFELYDDPGAVDFAEAVSVGRTYTALRMHVLPYEDSFDPAQLDVGALPSGGQDRIAALLQPAIAAVARQYDVEAIRADELLFVPRGQTVFQVDDPLDSFNGSKNDVDLIVGRSSADKILGGVGQDVLLGLRGRDHLEGGSGDDRLYGGTGADTLIGGNGEDKLWGGGNGDTLVGGRGDDVYVLGGDTELDPAEGGNPNAIGATNSDQIVEDARGGRDTVIVQVNRGTLDLSGVELLELASPPAGELRIFLNDFSSFRLSEGRDELTLVINEIHEQPVKIETGARADVVHVTFEKGVDPAQVLDGNGMTARFEFAELTANDRIDLTAMGIEAIFTRREQIGEDLGLYLLAPGVKLDVMDGDRLEKTYNNYTSSWFVVNCGDDTPYGPEFIGDIRPTNFEI